MSFSSRHLKEADELADSYSRSFGGKYSSSESSSFFGGGSFNFENMWKLIMLSKFRLAVLLGVCTVVILLLLMKTKPNMIMNRKMGIREPDTINHFKLIKYSFLFGFILSVCVFALSYKLPFIKKLLFREEDCDLCRA
jgi:hypothetical protein